MENHPNDPELELGQHRLRTHPFAGSWTVVNQPPRGAAHVTRKGWGT